MQRVGFFQKFSEFTKHLVKRFLATIETYWSFASYAYQAGKLNNMFLPFLPKTNNVVVLQVEAFDKGGLEEVVLTLARNLQQGGSFRVVVFVTSNVVGHLGMIARQYKIPVISLKGNLSHLRWLIRLFKVRLVSLHYSTFGVREYARAGVPIVYTVHNTYIWADPYFVTERSEQYKYVSHFIAVSEAVKDFFVTKFTIDPNLVTTIPNGLDLDYVALEEPVTRYSLGLTEEDIVFLNVSSFNWHKFHILMVAAMERLITRLPTAKLLFVGNTHDAGCRPFVEQEIKRRGLEDHIKILDYVPKGQVIGLMKQADCFVLPSLIEGWSIAIMEAMYSELPLILSDVGSAREVIANSDIGIIIRNPFPSICKFTSAIVSELYTNDLHLDNIEDLIAAMETIGKNKDEWKIRAKAGRDKIVNEFNSAHMCREYVSCFQDLMTKERLDAKVQ